MRILRYELQSDPEKNPHFRRRWTEAGYSPAELDRLADHELSVGHWHRAELLSNLAAEIREREGCR